MGVMVTDPTGDVRFEGSGGDRGSGHSDGHGSLSGAGRPAPPGGDTPGAAGGDTLGAAGADVPDGAGEDTPGASGSRARAISAAAIDFEDYATPLRDKSDEELRAANIVLTTVQNPWLMRAGTSLARLGLALRIPGAAGAIERTVFRQFCGGTSLEAALAAARRLHRFSVRIILDYAAESEKSEKGFEAAREEIERALTAAARGPEVAFCATKLTALVRDAVLERESAGAHLSEGEAAELERGEHRLGRLAGAASAAGASLFVDAEQSWLQPAIDRAIERVMRAENGDRAVVHTTVQLYLRDRLAYLRELVADARRRGYILGVKLVRGAYLEAEGERARERGAPSPVQPSKEATDADFDAATTLCLENIDVVRVCAATHNVASIRHMMREMERLEIPRGDPRVTSSQLLGMVDRLTFPLAESGYNALKYVPYGAVRSAFPYLLRRADENQSIAGQMKGELEAVRAELRRRGRFAL